jgi:hypothetical protein
MVWIGTCVPVHTVPKPERTTPGADYSYVEPVPADAPVRARFSLPHVAYFGSHESCGCGYNLGEVAWQGIDLMTDAVALLGAMTEEERSAFLLEQRSRERLRALVEAARVEGPVELFACWAGAEGVPATVTRTIAPTWISERARAWCPGESTRAGEQLLGAGRFRRGCGRDALPTPTHTARSVAARVPARPFLVHVSSSCSHAPRGDILINRRPIAGAITILVASACGYGAGRIQPPNVGLANAQTPVPTPVTPIQCTVVGWEVKTAIPVSVTTLPPIECSCGSNAVKRDPFAVSKSVPAQGSVELVAGEATVTYTSGAAGFPLELVLFTGAGCGGVPTTLGPPGGAGVIHVAPGQHLCAIGHASAPGAPAIVGASGTRP